MIRVIFALLCVAAGGCLAAAAFGPTRTLWIVGMSLMGANLCWAASIFWRMESRRSRRDRQSEKGREQPSHQPQEITTLRD